MSKTDRAPRRWSDATHASLIEAGIAAFGEHGFEALSEDAIARRAGLTRGAIQYQFGGKRGLFSAVFRHILAQTARALSDQTMERAHSVAELGEGVGVFMDLALDLGSSVVTTHIGVVPADPAHPRYAVMQEACRAMGEYGDKVGCRFAIETGPEKAVTLRAFLDSLGCRSMCVNLDPANLAMVAGDDPVAAVKTLAPYIVHTHAKDGRRNFYRDPEVVYGLVESEMLASPSFIELPLGEGDVPFPAYLKALDEIGYKGFLTIEREVGDNPEADIRKAVGFLQQHIQ